MERVALGCIGIRDMDKNKMYRDNIFNKGGWKLVDTTRKFVMQKVLTRPEYANINV